MGAYILRRLLLVIPTLIGVMIINFALTQFLPGGPVEQVLAQLEGEGDVLGAIAGFDDAGISSESADSSSGFDGWDSANSDLRAQIAKEFGLDRPPLERFLNMMWKYIQLDFGESYFQPKTVVALVLEKLPVSISLGLWSTLIIYVVSIPLGIRKAVRDGSKFDTMTSGIIIAAYAIPSFLFALLLLVMFAGGSMWQIFPLRGLTSSSTVWDGLSWYGKILDYLWHITLPTLAIMISGFAGLTFLTKNSFLDEIRKQYVVTARSKGLTENRVLYGHVFRNAMLIVIAGFPGMFVGIFFGSSLIIEIFFSLDGLGRLGYEAALQRDYPVIFGTLFVFGLLGLVVNILSDLMYAIVDPRIDFEAR